MARKRIGELLIKEGAISEAQLQQALLEQKRWGGRLGHVLIEMGFVDEEALASVLSRQLGLPRANLDAWVPSPEALNKISVDLCEKYEVFPIEVHLERRLLELAMSDPTAPGVLDEISYASGLRVVARVASPTEISRAILLHYHGESATSMVAGPQAVDRDGELLGGHQVAKPPPESTTEEPVTLTFQGRQMTFIDPAIHGDCVSSSGSQSNSMSIPPSAPQVAEGDVAVRGIDRIPGHIDDTEPAPGAPAFVPPDQFGAPVIDDQLSGFGDPGPIEAPKGMSHPETAPLPRIKTEETPTSLGHLGAGPPAAPRPAGAEPAVLLARIAELEGKVDKLNQMVTEQRDIVRGLIDLLVQSRTLSREDIVRMFTRKGAS